MHTRPVQGMPSAIHIRPLTAPLACGKCSAGDSRSPPSTRMTKPVDTGHIYTDPDSTAEYLLPTPLHAPMTRSPPGGVTSSSSWPLAVPQPQPKPQGYKPTKNIFSWWIEKKTQTSKNLGNVWTLTFPAVPSCWTRTEDSLDLVLWQTFLMDSYQL